MSQACNSHAQARQVGVGGAGILDRAAEVRERQTNRDSEGWVGHHLVCTQCGSLFFGLRALCLSCRVLFDINPDRLECSQNACTVTHTPPARLPCPHMALRWCRSMDEMDERQLVIHPILFRQPNTNRNTWRWRWRWSWGDGIGVLDAEPAAAAAGGDHGDDPRRVPVPRRRDRRGGHEEGGPVGE